MNYKPQIFIDEVIQCLVDKYVVMYQNIWGKGMARPCLSMHGYPKYFGKLSHIYNLLSFGGIELL